MEPLKFEDALKKLEKIVDELESGNLDLDKALQKFEEGIRLSRFCNEKLEKTEKKVEMLVKKTDGSGDFSQELFEPKDKEKKDEA